MQITSNQKNPNGKTIFQILRNEQRQISQSDSRCSFYALKGDCGRGDEADA